MTEDYARIIPPPEWDDSPTHAIGTVVMVGSSQLKGVHKVELVAEVGQPFWRAVINCVAHAPEVTAVAEINHDWKVDEGVGQS